MRLGHRAVLQLRAGPSYIPPHRGFEAGARGERTAEHVGHQLQQKQGQGDVWRAANGFAKRQRPVGGDSITRRSESGFSTPSSSSLRDRPNG